MLLSGRTSAKAAAVVAVIALMAMIWLPFGLPGAPSDSSNLDFWFMLHGKGYVGNHSGTYNNVALPDNDPNGPPPPPPPTGKQ
jgi:hypothetical protein